MARSPLQQALRDRRRAQARVVLFAAALALYLAVNATTERLWLRLIAPFSVVWALDGLAVALRAWQEAGARLRAQNEEIAPVLARLNTFAERNRGLINLAVLVATVLSVVVVVLGG